MTVVGLHPEELFDKLLDGEITQAERERLNLHLQSCEVCRFEHAARADFQAEALELGSSPPPLMPQRAPQVVVAATSPRRRRSRLVIWGLAAAALITASGAVASVVTGRAPWHAMSLLLTRPSAPQEPASAKPTKQAPRAAAVTPAAVNAPVAATPAVAATPSPVVDLASTRAGELRAQVGLTKTHSLGVAAARVKAVAAPASKDAGSKGPATPESTAKEPPAKEPAPAAKLFADANQARRSGDVGRAAGLYHLLQDQYPGSGEAELSRVTLSLLLLDSGDAQGALRGFERYLAGPSRGLEAEALVGRARSLGRLGRRDLETSAWQEVARKYPRSIYGRQASERLLALGQP